MGKIFSLALNERIMFRKSIYGDKQQNKKIIQPYLVNFPLLFASIV